MKQDAQFSYILDGNDVCVALDQPEVDVSRIGRETPYNMRIRHSSFRQENPVDHHGSRNQRYGTTSRFRLREYDYSTPGMYFITICTEGRVHRFGSVLNDQMQHTPAGHMVSEQWREAPARFPGIDVDAWVTMPNHIHALVSIGLESPNLSHASLSRVIQWYKSITTVLYTRGVQSENWPRFDGQLWQDGFHDHIVRNERDLERIREYIEANPARWKQDVFAT